MTRKAVADNLVSSAQIVMGEGDEGIPAVIIRGAPLKLVEDGDRKGPIRGRKGFRGSGNSGRGEGACFALWGMSADPDRVRGRYKGDHGEHQGRRLRCNGGGAAPCGVHGEYIVSGAEPCRSIIVDFSP